MKFFSTFDELAFTAFSHRCLNLRNKFSKLTPEMNPNHNHTLFCSNNKKVESYLSLANAKATLPDADQNLAME